MVTLKIVLHSRPNKDGLHQILLRITSDRKHSYFRSGLSVRQKEWNPAAKPDRLQWVRTSHPSHHEYNTALAALLGKAKLAVVADPSIESKDLIVLLSGREEVDPANNFLDFLLKETIRQESRQFRTGKRLRTLYKKLNEFCGGKNETKRRSGQIIGETIHAKLPFEKLTLSFLRDFAHHLEKQGNNATTVNSQINKLRTHLRLAIKEGLTNVPMPESYQLKERPNKKEALTADELALLINTELPNHGEVARLSKTTYLIQFYLHGARVGDVILLKRSSIYNGRVNFGMQKTGHAKSVEIVPELERLISPFLKGPDDGYLLPWIKKQMDETALNRRVESSTILINRYLKFYAAAAGIQKRLTSHTARHTFASIALGKINNVRTIQKLLGHSKIATTEVYLRELTTAETDAAAKSIYG